jgi:release factor glutamine methyltransferase
MTQEPWTIRRLLEWTTPFFERKSVDSPRLSAELLLAHILNYPRIKLYTDYDRLLNEKELAIFRSLVQRAAEHEPIAYLTGKAHFFSLEFKVTPDVLIPRPDTETLVEHVVQLCKHASGFESPRILDLCTGSGIIAAALAKNIPNAQVLATDISEKALAVAAENLKSLNLSDKVALAQGDLFLALKSQTDVSPYHLIVSNPPYIPGAQIDSLDRNVKDFEPRLALDGGIDGLMIIRRILKAAPDHLLPHGKLFIEIAFDQGDLAIEAIQGVNKFTDIRLIRDDSGNNRLLTGTLA